MLALPFRLRTEPEARRICFRSGVARRGLATAMMLSFAFTAEAQVFHVDNQSGSCSDQGPGTEAQPYCTINAAVATHGGAGVTIAVRPGTYREMVTVPASGANGSPYILQAEGPGVIIDGADDFGQPAQWTLSSGTVWLASAVTWDPKRVFVDGVPLDSSESTPPALPVNTFNYVAGQGLYVNLGGDSPGSHFTLVGRRANGFNLSGKSWVTIDGFEITRTEDRGIRLQSGCSNIVVSNNVVSHANSYGIHAVGGVNIVIDGNTVSHSTFHGIGLTSGTTGSTVRGNHTFLNARPDVRAANGIYLFDAPGNTLDGNRVHDNQDTGVQVQSGSNDCLLSDNLSWNNGDHGYDHLGATGTIHSNDVSYGNFSDGFSIEGFSTGTQLHNCISVENGLTQNQSDLYVDPGSAPGFVSDYNIFWNSTSQPPVNFMNVPYTSLAAYQTASQQDAHSLQADPRFVNGAAGDFHLLPGSPAIDSGDSGAPAWPALDLEGRSRVDVTSIPNTGAGPTLFADRGALEYQVGTGPLPALTLSPGSGPAPLSVTADASGSSDPDGTIVSFMFDFGDGAIVGPQPGSSAAHVFAAGTWTVTVTVTDNDSQSASVSLGVTVNSVLVADLALTPETGNSPLAVSADASASSSSVPIVSYSFDMGNGATFGPQPTPTASALYTPGVYTVVVTVENALGETASASRHVVVAEAAPGPNLVGNPSFESDTYGWVPVGGTVARVAGGFDGSASLRATATGGGLVGIDDASSWVDSTEAAGTVYRFRAWVRSPNGGGSVRLRVREHDSNGQQQGPPQQSDPVVLSPTWQLVTIDIACEAPGNNLDLRILDQPSVSGEAVDIDNVTANIVLGTSTIDVGDAIPGSPGLTVTPNPLRDRGSIRFGLSRSGPMRVELFDVKGRRVRVIADRHDAPASHYEFVLDGRGDDGRTLGPGLYLLRVQVSEGTFTRRFVILR